MTMSNTTSQIPVLGELTNRQDAKALADTGLLQGSLVRVDLGGLASITVLDGFETFVGPNGVLNLGGALFDTLLALAPEEGGNGGMPSPEDLPLIGQLIGLLDAGGFPDGGEFGLADEFIERLQNLFDPSNLTELPETFAGLLGDFFNF